MEEPSSRTRKPPASSTDQWTSKDRRPMEHPPGLVQDTRPNAAARGPSSRMGSPELLHQVRGKPLRLQPARIHVEGFSLPFRRDAHDPDQPQQVLHVGDSGHPVQNHPGAGQQSGADQRQGRILVALDLVVAVEGVSPLDDELARRCAVCVDRGQSHCSGLTMRISGSNSMPNLSRTRFEYFRASFSISRLAASSSLTNRLA